MQTRLALLLGALAAIGSKSALCDDGMVTLGVNPDLAAGAAALQRGRFEEGIARTQAGLDSVIPPGHRASALSNLCAGLTALRQYDIAIVHCSASLEADPGNWQAYNNRALAYLGKGLLRLARRDVRRGLRINPGGENLRRVEAMVEDAERRRPPGREPDPIA